MDHGGANGYRYHRLILVKVKAWSGAVCGSHATMRSSMSYISATVAAVSATLQEHYDALYC